MQGDIIGIVDKNSTVVARYSYDAWGKCTIDPTTTNVTIANINPFRYRSYYFDQGTNLYYLQSRYYDAEVGRFINGDEVEFAAILNGLLQSNLFSYCINNPINYLDDTGYWYFTVYDYYNINIARKKYNRRTKKKLKLFDSYLEEYFHNEYWIKNYSGYIYYQGAVPFSFMKFSGQSIDEVGCETIAIYNVMKKLGREPYYPQVISECYMNGLNWNSGKWGIRPGYIKKYFDAYSINYKKYIREKTFKENCKSGKICIVSFWNGKAYRSRVHTFAFYYKNKKYHTFNAYDICKKETPEKVEFFKRTYKYETYSELSKSKRFICGYVF